MPFWHCPWCQARGTLIGAHSIQNIDEAQNLISTTLLDTVSTSRTSRTPWKVDSLHAAAAMQAWACSGPGVMLHGLNSAKLNGHQGHVLRAKYAIPLHLCDYRER